MQRHDANLQEAARFATHDGVIQLLPRLQILLAAHADDILCLRLERPLEKKLLCSLGDVADALCIHALRRHVVQIPITQMSSGSQASWTPLVMALLHGMSACDRVLGRTSMAEAA